MSVSVWYSDCTEILNLFFGDTQIISIMRDVISGRVFDHTKRMTGDFIKSRIVRGGSGKVEQVMRAAGCDPLTPSAALSVYVLDTGKVNAAKLVLAGTMPNFEIEDVSSIFPNAPKSASMKFDNLNLNSL